MPAPQEILKLVERFDQNRESYLSPDYKEARLRAEFIDPFFCELGWDMYNKQGYAEAYKDVIFEDSIKIGSATEAPDYCFRIGGARKFFAEAKKPSVSIKDAVSPAYQLRRYAWSSKLPLSILTDFDEFAVYDCRIKPDKKDTAATARIMYLSYRDYEKKWDEIASIFARESILKGSFDKFAEGVKGKKGTASVDDSFLEEIERWREILAKNIALRNSVLTTRELNFAVQKTIDRIIFLRICEDRGIEMYGKLASFVNGDNVYKRLLEYFRTADARYNSGLFHFQAEKGISEEPDYLTQRISIDDKFLKEIIGGLYYPECPFEFSVLPADILGQVYERFLGKVIRLTAGHQAKVEEKPEVRKAGGVYYTPTYIVDYIVENTVCKLLEGRKVDSKIPLRVADISCGSGSFLIVAYQKLLDWYLKKYTENEPEKYAKGKIPRIRKGRNGEWKLTINERKRILLEHIYGVDIDSQAVEVTKLSLLLKVLEGENEEIFQGLLFQERALPDLGSNIKCGNSLIGSDYYANRQGDMFNEEEMIRVNAFDWESQFPEIFSRKDATTAKEESGFDCVIGNPPYVRQETLGEEFKTYAQSHYKTFAGTADLYVYFFEKAHQVLKRDGYFGMICSNKFMRAKYGNALRNFLSENSTIRQIIDFGELPVFENAATFPAIFLTQNNKRKNQKFTYAPIKRLNFSSLPEEVKTISYELDSRSLTGDNWTLASVGEINIFDKMKKVGIPLGEYVKGKIYRGVLTGLNEAFVIDAETRKRLIKEDAKSAEIIKPFVIGDDVRKYRINFKDRYLILFEKGWTELNKKTDNPQDFVSRKYPAIFNHLLQFEEKAKVRTDQGDYWWELRACEYYDDFQKPKIIWPEIAKESRFTYDGKGFYLNKTCFFSPVKDLYILGVLNSNSVWFFLKRLCSVLGDADKDGRLLQQKIYIEQIPIPPKPTQDRITPLVTKMLDLHKRLSEATIPDMKTMLQWQIEATDKEIDRLVYELYGLTDEEIKIVEGD